MMMHNLACVTYYSAKELHFQLFQLFKIETAGGRPFGTYYFIIFSIVLEKFVSYHLKKKPSLIMSIQNK